MALELTRDCPLFEGIEPDQLAALLDCLSARTQSFKKGEFVFRRDEPARYVGIVLEGGVHVIQEDFWGNRTILDHIDPGELFGESLSCAELEQIPVSVVTTSPSKIMLIDYRRIITVCPSTCVFHARLIANMLSILASKNIMLTRKMEYISQRTTREKLLAFLSTQALRAKSREVVVPYNRQELADFLCVDRSALSRELSLMKKEGILDYDKNCFVLSEQP